MPESCTCGTVLVENARFCHRCGRAAGGEPVVDAEDRSAADAVAAVTEALAARKPLPVSFANPVALRVAFVMSLALMILEMIPGLNLLFLVWWLGAGFGAVLLYRRLTGLALSVPAGARLGSITGILTFVSMAVIFALTMVFMGKDLFQQMVKQDPQISEVMDNPPAMAALFLLVLAIIFAMVVGTCAAGGALGARFAARDNPVAR
jgi:hypothetical protein